MTDAEKARIKAEGCLMCGDDVHVLPEGVLCQGDCRSLIPLSEYRNLFAIKAGYEDVVPKGEAK